MKRLLIFLFLHFCIFTFSYAQQWPTAGHEARPYTRWWWMGSAVDSAGIDAQLTAFARAGFGGVEIAPIYGVQENEQNELPFLSHGWMKMLRYTEERAAALGLRVDMTTGTGWPFGGKEVPLDQSACKAVFKDGKLLLGRTRQQVKRAAPGGEGFVIDHFDHDAVHDYLTTFSTEFLRNHTIPPKTFFCDSYEVYGADWTPLLLSEFEQRRGYKLQDHFPVFLLSDSVLASAADEVADEHRRVLSDYRETLGELLLENFTTQWSDWAHGFGSQTRCQAHGSPANLLDIYAAVDIPECEGFGLSDFHISGLRTDPGFTRRNDSDISMLKYASSAAHIANHPLTSSETFTWLTEHFRTSLSQCKPDLDLMFVAGVNHVVFHGSCYSPKDELWPGWRFYATSDFTSYNPWWEAIPAFSKYIERCQSFLQWGRPDNDFLVYLPYYDMLYDQPGRLLLFDIHSMQRRAPNFIEAIQHILHCGYDVDYISDRYLQTDAFRHYKAVIVPDVRFMPVETLQRLNTIAQQGIQVIFVGHFPQSLPGLGRAEKDSISFTEALSAVTKNAILASTYEEALSIAKGRKEALRYRHGLSCIRRANDEGHHYFISNLSAHDIDDFIELGVDFTDALFYNPMNGLVSRPEHHGNRVRFQLASGESIILKTSKTKHFGDAVPHHYSNMNGRAETIHGWRLSFTKSEPVAVRKSYKMDTPASWTTLGNPILLSTMATGCYSASFNANADETESCCYMLDLGDVREWARVVVNGQEVGVLFAVPFRINITPFVHSGKNRLEIFVTNLPANRISQMDRDGVAWRHFKEINVVDLNYKTTLYSDWNPVSSGLCSDVKLVVEPSNKN